jgi:hypothetical protein
MSDENPISQPTQQAIPFKPIFKGTGNEEYQPEDSLNLPTAPTWRRADQRKKERGATFQARDEEIELVNAAMYLRRPLLYDAIARLQDASTARQADDAAKRFENIGDYIRLGPLGTALLPSKKPRILIVDEIDKSDIDLPNDLLYVFEEGQFDISELLRIEEVKPSVTVRTAYRDKQENTFDDGYQIKQGKTDIIGGKVVCEEFPLMILTSNGERDFPPPFLRRCVRLTMEEPDSDRLTEIVNAHLQQQIAQDSELGEAASGPSAEMIKALVEAFVEKRKHPGKGDLATDQLLNAVYLVMRDRTPDLKTREALINRLWKYLSSSEDQKSDSSR